MIAQLTFRHAQPVLGGHHLGGAQRAAARNDGHFVYRIRARQQPGHERVAGFMIGRLPLLLLQQHLLAFGAHQHFVAGVVEILHVDFLLVVPRGPQGGFVDDVADVRPGQPDRAGGQAAQVHVVRQRHVPHVDLEDLHSPLVRRPIHGDVPVETAGPQQRGIQHVGPVRRSHDDHRVRLRKAVHLAEDLVQRLFALVVAAAQSGPALAPNGVDFVDENDGRSIVLGVLEQVAHAAGADAHEHLNELAGAHRVKRHAGFPRHRAGQQRLARARRPVQQHALGHPPAQPLELLRALQVLDDLLQVRLDALQTGHVVERDRLVRRFVAPRRTLAEPRQETAAHELVPRPAEGHPKEDEQAHGQRDGDQRERHHHRVAGRLVGDLHAAGQQLAQQLAAGLIRARQRDAEVLAQLLGFAGTVFGLRRDAVRPDTRRCVRRLLEHSGRVDIAEFHGGDVAGLGLLDLRHEEVIADRGPLRTLHHHQHGGQHQDHRDDEPQVGPAPAHRGPAAGRPWILFVAWAFGRQSE